MDPIRRRLVRLAPRRADCGLLRHAAATWLRREVGDTRLVAEYLGHADLSTVARYAHVDREELFAAVGRLEQIAAPREESPAQVAPDQVSTGDGSDHPRSQSERSHRRRRSRRRGGR
jgi:hypothetical protein